MVVRRLLDAGHSVHLIPIHVDQPVGDRLQRARMYDGAINITTPSATSVEFAMFARELMEEAFGGGGPPAAQFGLPRKEYAAIPSVLAPPLLQHPASKR